VKLAGKASKWAGNSSEETIDKLWPGQQRVQNGGTSGCETSAQELSQAPWILLTEG